jgi:hypothetical protein
VTAAQIQTEIAPPKLMAFTARAKGDYEGTSATMLFAFSGEQAREALVGDDEDREFAIERSQWADRYAPGPVPWIARLHHGWYCDCHGCGVTISENAEDTLGRPKAFRPVQDGEEVFCSAKCMMRSRSARRNQRRAQSRMLQLYKRLLFDILGPVRLQDDEHHVHIIKAGRAWVPAQVILRFDFPGRTGMLASFEFRHSHSVHGPCRPQFNCSQGDLQAFKQFLAMRNRKKLVTLSPRQLELVRHATGLSQTRHRVSYRNRFYSGPGHADFVDWQDMVAKGAAVRITLEPGAAGERYLFLATLAGASAALRPREALDTEDFPSWMGRRRR